jgi:hypothetical protein
MRGDCPSESDYCRLRVRPNLEQESGGADDRDILFGLISARLERGIFAGAPFGILLTVGWFAFPLGRIIFKRIRTRPRE